MTFLLSFFKKNCYFYQIFTLCFVAFLQVGMFQNIFAETKKDSDDDRGGRATAIENRADKLKACHATWKKKFRSTQKSTTCTLKEVDSALTIYKELGRKELKIVCNNPDNLDENDEIFKSEVLVCLGKDKGERNDTDQKTCTDARTEFNKKFAALDTACASAEFRSCKSRQSDVRKCLACISRGDLDDDLDDDGDTDAADDVYTCGGTAFDSTFAQVTLPFASTGNGVTRSQALSDQSESKQIKTCGAYSRVGLKQLKQDLKDDKTEEKDLKKRILAATAELKKLPLAAIAIENEYKRATREASDAAKNAEEAALKNASLDDNDLQNNLITLQRESTEYREELMALENRRLDVQFDYDNKIDEYKAQCRAKAKAAALSLRNINNQKISNKRYSVKTASRLLSRKKRNSAERTLLLQEYNLCVDKSSIDFSAAKNQFLREKRNAEDKIEAERIALTRRLDAVRIKYNKLLKDGRIQRALKAALEKIKRNLSRDYKDAQEKFDSNIGLARLEEAEKKDQIALLNTEKQLLDSQIQRNQTRLNVRYQESNGGGDIDSDKIDTAFSAHGEALSSAEVFLSSCNCRAVGGKVCFKEETTGKDLTSINCREAFNFLTISESFEEDNCGESNISSAGRPKGKTSILQNIKSDR